MNLRILPYGILTALLCGSGAQLFADKSLAPEKWSRFQNDSSKTYLIQYNGTHVGTVNVKVDKDANEAKDGKPLESYAAGYRIKGKFSYQVYYRTIDPPEGGHKLDIDLLISEYDDTAKKVIGNPAHLIVRRGMEAEGGKGDAVFIRPATTLTDTPLTLNLLGFRNIKGAPFLVFNEVLLDKALPASLKD